MTKTVREMAKSWAAFFVWVDIDGRGEIWRIAVRRRYAGKPGIYFPVEDFEDYRENYADCPASKIVAPEMLRK